MQVLHVKVQGQFTKASATYVPLLVQALADTFFEAIQQVTQRRREELDLEVSGLENQLVHEVALSSDWQVHSSWTFKTQGHIRLANFLSRERRPLRVVALVDSYVVRGATSKVEPAHRLCLRF